MLRGGVGSIYTGLTISIFDIFKIFAHYYPHECNFAKRTMLHFDKSIEISGYRGQRLNSVTPEN